DYYCMIEHGRAGLF
nr:immunoglobulin light chain junction region [Macaca mulatta]